jgi:EAL domain-containing protein (putative c-di-GMP-specific phosphodiesterase class I)
MGIKIAMDDFGTGYSSLNYLRRYPFDSIKIDREFVSDMTYDMGDRELVNAAIVMAHSLDLRVIAEGVETQEQLSDLEELGCGYAQGYLLGRPMPAEELTAVLKQQNEPACVDA